MNKIIDLINRIDCLLDCVDDEYAEQIRSLLNRLEEAVDELNEHKQKALEKLDKIERIL